MSKIVRLVGELRNPDPLTDEKRADATAGPGKSAEEQSSSEQASDESDDDYKPKKKKKKRH